MSVFPLRTAVDAETGDPRVVDLEAEDADAVFDALASETARDLYTAVAKEPRTASDLAEALDSSIQNVRYHLDNLQEAGLVEVVDTWYSSRGSEMKVYGTSDGPLVLMAGERESRTEIQDALKTLVGGTAVLALLGALINWATRTPEQSQVMMASGETAATGGVSWLFALPGLLFTLGGFLVLLGVTGYLLLSAR
ncbi:MAG: ArsR/SmtB family transcription factor [Halodesulfurarchaeum sp.]